ncbi:hypothetical protein TNCV_1925531 [Trichonephila clavipes]|nr:hypothetical protein TNCV_1925531 [Trichonephila clavipes]
MEGEERWEAPDHPQVSSFKIGVGKSQIALSPVWCSKLQLTTGVTESFAMINFVGLDLAFADQVASITTTTPSLNRESKTMISLKQNSRIKE